MKYVSALFMISLLFASEWNAQFKTHVEDLLRDGRDAEAETLLNSLSENSEEQTQISLYKTFVYYRQGKWQRVLEQGAIAKNQNESEVLGVRLKHMMEEAEKALGVIAPSGKRYTKPYGMAGCGLGSVLKSQSQSQLAALSTNVTFSQTVSISFGTSNCREEGIIRESYEAALFLDSHRELLALELAQGQGDHLAVLAEIAGCDSGELTSMTWDGNLENLETYLEPQLQNCGGKNE